MTNSLDRTTIITDISQRVQDLINLIGNQLKKEMSLSTAQDLDVLEESLHCQTRQLADLIVAHHLQKNLDKETLASDVKQLIGTQEGNLKHCGYRQVSIRFKGGTSVSVHTVYFARNCDKKKRKKGLYPALKLLGIHERCSPGLASRISISSAALCSFEEAQHSLSQQGCDLNIKTIRNIVKRFAARARLAQQCDDQDLLPDSNSIKGRRIVVSTDGGRLRLRTKKRGPKTKKGRHRFHTDWKEPKLFIIYMANEDGRQDKVFPPIIDGTLDGPDDTFSMLAYYLKKLDIVTADKVLFVADGALWIWERAKKILLSVGLRLEQVFELIDFYHAVEHLNHFAKLKKKWSTAGREKWVKKMRKILLNGNIDDVINVLKTETKGSKNSDLRKERQYFIKNRDRMLYKQIAELNLPIGSGAIESSIRRVVNLRLKGPCIYWNEDTANEMLMLRSFYKSGRWNLLEKWAFHVG